MKEYFYSVICASVICAVASSLFVNSSAEKYIKYISALIACVIILSPLAKLRFDDQYNFIPDTSEGFDISDGESLMYSFLESEGKKALEEYFYNIILSNFGIKPKSVSITIEYVNGNAIIKGAEVILEDDADTEKIKNYLKENFGELEWKVS